MLSFLKYFSLAGIFTAWLLCPNITYAKKSPSDSSQNGIYKKYFPSGKLEWKGKFKNKQRHGIFIIYDENGTLLSKSKYKKGKWIWTMYYENSRFAYSIDHKGRRKKGKDCNCP